MRSEAREKVAIDLLSIPPLIFRRIRSKLNKNTAPEYSFNITILHFEILVLLEDEGPLHIAEIGERLHIAKAQMTQLSAKLVEMGLVERNFDPADRRIINISLTDQGKSILAEHKSNIMASMRESISSLSEQELEELSISLQRLQKILSRLN
jgi:DNA-binding MarR family transcriptional regulator